MLRIMWRKSLEEFATMDGLGLICNVYLMATLDVFVRMLPRHEKSARMDPKVASHSRVRRVQALPSSV